jgi:sugar phosphate isomerase/epimerase
MDQSDCIARRKFLSIAAAAPILGAAGCALQPKQKEEWRIGCFTRPWAAYDVVTAMDAIAESGFRYMGLMNSAPNGQLLITLQTSLETAARIGEQARARGLGILSAYGGDFPVRESIQAGIQGLKQLIDLCVACGSQSLLLGGTGREDLFDDYFKVVAYAALCG